MPLGASRLSFLAFQAAAAGRTAITLTAQQQVQVSTAQSKFGGASAYFDGGTDDYILVDHTQFSHAYSDNFTYECWFRLDSLPSLFTMLATGSTRGDYLSIYKKSGTWTVTAPVSDGSTAYTQIRNIGFTPSINTWYHVALVKDGASLKMFFDGTELTTNNGSAGTMSADKGWNGVSRIGDWAGGTNYATSGYIDEVRWSSTARYTSSFTPSTTAFTNDSDTLLLVHMDGANGSTTFTDDNS
ncbi:LamG domain-containing protein [Candidatus Pelagibacter sp.]|nr:LamG domain-containing protein [Candidatus Pelagibacter sp.]